MFYTKIDRKYIIKIGVEIYASNNNFASEEE